MPQYDFRSLSANDFEHLVRDLLQQEFCAHVESFTTGRDSGIDLRFLMHGQSTVIVQCKHYVESGYAKLLNHIKTVEAPKVQRLHPKRYILATSVGLTPKNKDELSALLTPHSAGPQDVYGADDLNNLIGRHPDVERTHFKLWLTSSEVLRTLLHSELFNETEAERVRIATRLRLYVQHESYSQAAALLDRFHYCIIAGQPGIGKTTLAETLTVAHLAQGYEVVVVSSDIRDAFRAYTRNKLQLFIYDDFLGTTALEAALHKNEDSSLLRLLELIGQSQTSRLILTTRELILNQARQVHEKLATARIDVARCTITVGSYKPLQRAAILHNHVWFSKLPADYKRALLDRRAYRKILAHPNYVPRIIEWMTAPSIVEQVPAEKYVDEFLDYLQHPYDLWRTAFEQQLSERARHLLLVIATLPPSFLSTVEGGFDAYRSDICREYSLPRSPLDFRHSIRELEEAFISVEHAYASETRTDAVVKVLHPSVSDFLEAHLRASPREVTRLARTAVAFEQLVRLWAIIKDGQGSRPEGFVDAVWASAERLMSAAPVRVERSVGAEIYMKLKSPYYSTAGQTPEVRLDILHGMAVEAPSTLGSQVLPKLGASHFQALKEDRRIDSEGGRRLLESLLDDPVDIGFTAEDIAREAKTQLLNDFAGVDDLECLCLVADRLPQLFSEDDLQTLNSGVSSLVKDTVRDSGPEKDYLERLDGALDSIGSSLRLDVSEARESIAERTKEIEEQETERADFEYDGWREAAADAKEEERAIDRMFEVFNETELPVAEQDEA